MAFLLHHPFHRHSISLSQLSTSLNLLRSHFPPVILQPSLAGSLENLKQTNKNTGASPGDPMARSCIRTLEKMPTGMVFGKFTFHIRNLQEFVKRTCWSNPGRCWFPLPLREKPLGEGCLRCCDRKKSPRKCACRRAGILPHVPFQLPTCFCFTESLALVPILVYAFILTRGFRY